VVKVIVQDIATNYEDEGQGPVLLLLHGWGNTLNYYDSLCSELKEFRVVRLDLPGFGSSEIPRSAWNVEMYARFVAQFCEKLHLEPKAMIGHSFGGRIITKGVGQKILHPEKIILIASAGVADRQTLRNALYAGIAKMGKVILAPLPTSLYQRAREKLYAQTGSDYLTTGTMSETFLLTIREDLSVDATAITIPVLLVWGLNDLVTPLQEGKRLNTLIRNSKLCVISNAGHFVHQEKPAEVAQLIKDFLV
jgi:pimeloyl-ACP methyl ester carboxylesterase